MSYHISTTVNCSFNEAIERVTAALKDEGFGVLTDIDVAATFKKKIDVDFRPYRILGACNPSLAHEALNLEDKIGVMLPCNVIVQEKDGVVEVAAVDPVESIGRVGNPDLDGAAQEVNRRLTRVINAL